MQVSLIQVGFDGNESVADRVERVAGMVRDAAGSDLVLLPELWPHSAFDYRTWSERAEPLDGPTATAMSAAARDAGVLLHAGSIVEQLESPGVEGKALSNTSLVFSPDGDLVTTYRKIHRFGFAKGEPQLMEPGTDLGAMVLPGGVAAGVSTCYDLRFPELYRAQLDAGAKVFVIPAAWPTSRVAHWTLLGRARAVENQCFVLACNVAGTQAGLEMGGHSQIVGPLGDVVAEAGTGEAVLTAALDLAEVDRVRESFPVLADRRI